MTAPDDIAALAAGLTKAQREFVCSPLYSGFSVGISAAWFHDTRYWDAREIARKGLAVRRRIVPGWFATIPNDLGLRVRQHLLDKERG